jgi:hypothetical protein
MPTCFVVQPFDSDKYDQRFDEIYSVAITDAGLEPYRVDRDHSVAIPIADIESAIRNSAVCFADISEDNPNVWFEFGYAIASGKEVLIVCDIAKRDRFPFDVQHRKIIRYRTASPSDFTKLQSEITLGLKHALERSQKVQRLEDTIIAPSDGLDEFEVALCATIAAATDPGESRLSLYQAKQAMERLGYTGLAIQFAFRKLQQKGFIQMVEEHEYNGEPFAAIELQGVAWAWLMENQNRFLMKSPKQKASGAMAIDDDVPF